MGRVISFFGSGGSGKSTVAINTAITLAKEDKLVCVLGANTLYGSTQRHLGVEIPKEKSLTQAILRPTMDMIKKCVVHAKGADIFIVSLSNSDDVMALTHMDEQDVMELIVTLKNMFDYLIIDGTDRPNDKLMFLGFRESDRIIEVVHPSLQGIAYHNAHQVLIDKLVDSNRYDFIFNARRQFLNKADVLNVCVGEAMMEIPFSYKVEASEAEATPVCLSGNDKKYIKAIEALTLKIKDPETMLGAGVLEEQKRFSFFKGKKGEGTAI